MKKTLFYVLLCLPFLSYSQDPEVLDNKKLLINRIFVEGHYKMRPDSLMRVLVPQIRKERDSLLAMYLHHPGQQAGIRYYYANGILDLSDRIPQKSSRDLPWEPLLTDTVFAEIPLPGVDELAGIRAANLFVDHYVRYRLVGLFLRTRDEGDQVLSTELGHSLDSLGQMANHIGELGLGLLYSKKILPEALAPRYLSNQLAIYIGRKNLALSELILRELNTHFPDDPAIPKATMEIAQLHKLLAINAESSDVVFIRNSDSIGSVAELLAPFAGKVVYLDFWGTWCGPCVQELTQYTEALKVRFKEEKDLVFLYMAMERPDDHEKWKQFIALHNLTGYHITKTDVALEPFWEELLGTKDVPRYFPTYMIFDRKGNLENDQAFRPSQGEALYLQLEEVLNK